MRLSEAIRGFLLVRAMDLSSNTSVMYEWALNNLARYLNDPEVSSIKEKDLLNFFAYLQKDYPANEEKWHHRPAQSTIHRKCMDCHERLLQLGFRRPGPTASARQDYQTTKV